MDPGKLHVWLYLYFSYIIYETILYLFWVLTFDVVDSPLGITCSSVAVVSLEHVADSLNTVDEAIFGSGPGGRNPNRALDMLDPGLTALNDIKSPNKTCWIIGNFDNICKNK